VTVSGTAYAIPVGYKALLLYYDSEILPGGPPRSIDDVPALARGLRSRGIYALAYDATNFFYHAPFFLAGGGRIFDGDRLAVFDEPRAFARPVELKRAGAIPDEASTALATELFNSGRAAMVLSGPWFAGDITLPQEKWGVAPLFEGMGSFVTVEGIFLSATAGDKASAAEAARAIAREIATSPSEGAKASDEAIRAAEEPAMRAGLVTPLRPEMSLVWDPAKDLLRDVLERGVPLDEAIVRARHTLEVTSRPDPAPVDPKPYEAAASALLAALALYAAVRAVRTDALRRAVRPGARFAYGLVLPAFVAMGILVVLPFVAGAAVSLFSYRAGAWSFVGLSNFSAVLSPSDVPPTRPGSFYFILVVTALWTLANVALHVALGVALALLLRRPWLMLRGAYRVLLILPWAVPSYITALIWKGMFNQQFGAINALLNALGLEPVSWFSRFSTAFAANLATNTWLGFPFMMVITLGALQGIPPELEEVAALEGATSGSGSRWSCSPRSARRSCRRSSSGASGRSTCST
jgi:arabinogalactan oligomer/maltooligosaccharide transport system permease protein